MIRECLETLGYGHKINYTAFAEHYKTSLFTDTNSDEHNEESIEG